MNNAYDNEQTDREMSQRHRLDEHLLDSLRDLAENDNDPIMRAVAEFMRDEQSQQNCFIEDPADTYAASLRIVEIQFEGILHYLEKVMAEAAGALR